MGAEPLPMALDTPDRMLTGLQIRTARRLLKWAAWRLCREAKLNPVVFEEAENAAGAARLNGAQEARLRLVFEEAGIELVAANGVASCTVPGCGVTVRV